MNNLEKLGTGAAAIVGVGSMGAAAGYFTFGLRHNGSIDGAQKDMECVDALADMSGTFEALPTECATSDLLTIQERDKSREEFFTITKDGNISQRINTQELITFDSIETIAETAAVRLDHAEAEKHDDQMMGLYGGAAFGVMALIAYAAYRVSRRPVGKHSKSNRQTSAVAPKAEPSASTESRTSSPSKRTKVPVATKTD